MAEKFVVAYRVFFVAVALWCASAWAGEAPSPLLGLSKAQLISRLGEPRSQIEQGDRVLFFYPREKLTLRGDVVVEVEVLVPDIVRRPAETPPPETPPPATATPGATAPGATTPTPTPAAPTPVPETTSAPEPKVEIKSVRRPGEKDPTPPPTPTPVTPKAVTPAPEVTPAPAPEEKKPTVDPLAPTKAELEAIEARKKAEKEAALEKERQAKAAKEARRRLDQAADAVAAPKQDGISPVWYAIIGVVVAGIAFMIWRSRRIEIAPNREPSPTPGLPLSSNPARAAGNVNFTPEFLAGLEWKGFEALVAAYYSKTGVVAARTNSGPETPVHIKISWKGEPRPFAYVRCLAHPSGQVDAKPLKELITAMAADDIRRGYVVTPGQFNGAARDLAGQKQLTLLSGDVFLEKLNALPPPARKEIMQEAGVAG